MQSNDFVTLQENISQVQKELNSIIVNIKDQTSENCELRSTFEKSQKDIESFKKTTNFRMNLFQSKEAKQINDFFTKYLNPETESLMVKELKPLKDLLAKIREENSILKKQLELNPVAVEKGAKVMELQKRLDHYEQQFDP